MPLTPIGKIYKPALRALAAKRAIEEALAGLGLSAQDCDVLVSESGSVIRLADATREDAVKAALMGMPLILTIECGTR